MQGAPDLALTQFSIETLSTVLFVLVLRFLPRTWTPAPAARGLPARIAVSLVVGVGIFVFALVASQARSDVEGPSMSEAMIEGSEPLGKGSNVVNVILVDFRGWDTMGEITVLLVAAVGAVSLARSGRRRCDRAAPVFEEIVDCRSSRVPRRPRSDTPVEPIHARPMALLDTSIKVLYPSILVLGIYFLFAGHNRPGGGFVGGLVIGARALAALRGRRRRRGSLVVPAPARTCSSAVGLLVAATTALAPVLLGGSILEHGDIEFDLPLFHHVKVTSALPFDLGVDLVVIGLCLMAFAAFGEDDPGRHRSGDDGSDAPGCRTAGLRPMSVLLAFRRRRSLRVRHVPAAAASARRGSSSGSGWSDTGPTSCS